MNGDPELRCGRKTRKGTPCQYVAGYKTDHVGTGACKYHGGASFGAPEGNKNALKTGEYEKLHVSTLTEEERLLYSGLDASPRAQAEAAIRLYSIREQRILLRIRHEMENLLGNEGLAGEAPSGHSIASVSTYDGWNVKGKVDYSVVERSSPLEKLQKLEEALTRIQAQKTRATELLFRIDSQSPPEDDPLEEFLEHMRGRREERAKNG